jgi:hypothetical protein
MDLFLASEGAPGSIPSSSAVLFSDSGVKIWNQGCKFKKLLMLRSWSSSARMPLLELIIHNEILK